MKRVIIVVGLISLILVALFMAAKPGNKSPIIPQANIPQPASPSVTEELPPTAEQQEALIEASSTLTPTETTSAQLTEKTNIVEYRLNGATEWKSAQIDQKFMNGDTLRTGADSEAQLSFSDGSTVRLNGLTQITINPADKEIHLSIGKIFVSFFRGTASPKVVTPNAVAAALGTMWVQEQKEDGTSQINVLEGQVNFTSEGTSEIVDEGNFTKALHKKPPAKPQKFNIDNYTQSEKVLKKVKLKKLAELHKKHDTAFQEKLKDHPELLKKYEEKVNRLKVEKEEKKEIKKEIIEKKLEEKKELKPQIKEKIEEKKLQQNENIKKQLEEKKAENIEKKKELFKENLEEKKLQQNEKIKKPVEEKKTENVEKKKGLIQEKKQEYIEKKLQNQEEQNKPVLHEKANENKFQQNEKIKKQIEEKSTKTQEIKKKPIEENKKPQVQEDNKKKVLEDKKNQENKKKLIEEKKFQPNQPIKQ